MRLIAGVDIGNSTTEVCIGGRDRDGRFMFLAGASRPTTGTKGTVPNIHGIRAALKDAMDSIREPVSALELIRLNEAGRSLFNTLGTDHTISGGIHLTIGGLKPDGSSVSEAGRQKITLQDLNDPEAANSLFMESGASVLSLYFAFLQILPDGYLGFFPNLMN